jgi:hypothetical protein
MWNSQHAWPSFAFQLRRLALTEVRQQNDLPKPTESLKEDSPEKLLTQNLLDKENRFQKEAPKKKVEKTSLIPPFVSRLLDYLGGLFILWGALLFPLLFLLRKKNRKRKKTTLILPPKSKALLLTATTVPLCFFFVISFFTKVEANWSAIYMLTAIPLLGPYLSSINRGLLLSASINAILVLTLGVHAKIPFLPIKHDRLLKESFGFQQFSHHINTLPEPIFADSYQLTSMLRFYEPNKNILQWPAMNRPSELTYNPIYVYSLNDLKNKNEFWLATSDLSIPHLASFKPVYAEFLKDCWKNTELTKLSTSDHDDVDPSYFDCKYTHHWMLIQYINEMASD